MRVGSKALAFVGIGMILVGGGTTAWAEKSAEEKTHSPAEVFRAMADVFQVEKAKGLHIRYLFHLGEPQGGDWWIKVDDGKMSMGRGALEKPDCTIVCTGADWVALDNVTLSGMRAYLSGRLKIQGDRNLAKKLNELFP